MTIHSPMDFANVGRFKANAAMPGITIVALPLVVAVALAVVGAFGSYVAMGLPVRLLHFGATSLVIGLLAFAVSTATRRYVLAGALPLWASILIAVALAPLGAMIVQQSLRFCAPHALYFVTFGELTAQVLLINLIVGTLARLFQGPSEAPVEATLTSADTCVAKDVNTLRAKLPMALRHAAILSLSAEDHYVRVRTDRGQALVLMNLAHAIEMLGPQAGVRIHRSHWIGRDLAASLTQKNSRAGVRLDDATVLPISRTGRKLLNEMRAGRDVMTETQILTGSRS